MKSLLFAPILSHSFLKGVQGLGYLYKINILSKSTLLLRYTNVIHLILAMSCIDENTLAELLAMSEKIIFAS